MFKGQGLKLKFEVSHLQGATVAVHNSFGIIRAELLKKTIPTCMNTKVTPKIINMVVMLNIRPVKSKSLTAVIT